MLWGRTRFVLVRRPRVLSGLLVVRHVLRVAFVAARAVLVRIARVVFIVARIIRGVILGLVEGMESFIVAPVARVVRTVARAVRPVAGIVRRGARFFRRHLGGVIFAAGGAC